MLKVIVNDNGAASFVLTGEYESFGDILNDATKAAFRCIETMEELAKAYKEEYEISDPAGQKEHVLCSVIALYLLEKHANLKETDEDVKLLHCFYEIAKVFLSADIKEITTESEEAEADEQRIDG